MRFFAPLVRRPAAERPVEARYTTDDYAQWLAQSWGFGSFGYQGSQYPTGVQTTQPGSKTEPIPENFSGYYAHGMRGNSPVATCMMIRLQVFEQARFKFRQLRDGRPGRLFGSRDLAPLEGDDLMAEMVTDVDLAGNFYGALVDGQVTRLRPDWCDLVLEPLTSRFGPVGYRKVGLFYYPDGHRDTTPSVMLAGEFVHFIDRPDPHASFRGMSWLTPVVREIVGDTAYTKHKSAFIENSATPNLAVSLAKEITPEQFKVFVEEMDAQHKGPANAGKTLYTAGGADVTVVGSNMHELDFKVVQGAGETRIAAASGVGAVIAQFSEGMQGSSLNAGNYQASRRRFADITMRHLWQRAAKACAVVVRVPAAAELWYDDEDIPFLQEDELDAAEILSRKMLTIESGVRAGYTPESIVAAVDADDLSLLQHTGLFSVQLQPPMPNGPAVSSNGSSAPAAEEVNA